MGSTSAEHRPADGYGVVPIGKRWMPVKWVPEAGAGAYRGLRDDDRAAPDGTPKTCSTYDEATRFTWLALGTANALLRAMRDVEVSGDAPTRIAAKPPKRAKPTGHEARRAPQTSMESETIALAPGPIMVPVLTPLPTAALTPAVVPIVTPRAAMKQVGATGKARTKGHRKARRREQVAS